MSDAKPSQPADERIAKAAQAEVATTFAEFLETKPPGTVVKISDLMTTERNSNGAVVWRLSTPTLHLHCDSDHCKGLRYFRFENGDRQPDRDGTLSTFVTYICSNCQVKSKFFALYLVSKPAADGECTKYGELPSFGPITPTRLLKMLGEESRDLFKKGRRCESQGLGIGAFVYYRRVVEQQRSSIINEIIRVARIINAPVDMVATLEAAEKETQFSKSLDMIKEAIPESLRIQGHNPITLLHDSLSTGLHAQTDTECLEIAQAIRVVLSELAERIANALKDSTELTKALGKLMTKKSKASK